MVRNKTPGKRRTLNSTTPGAVTTNTNVSGTSAFSTPTSNRSNISLNQSQSRRKSTPRKVISKHGTKSYVGKRIMVVDKFGTKDYINRKTFKQIHDFQKSVKNLIPKLPFSRLIKEILFDLSSGSDVSHVSSTALAALQESAELYLVCLFSDCNLVAFHAKRKTIKPTDMALVITLRQNH